MPVPEGQLRRPDVEARLQVLAQVVVAAIDVVERAGRESFAVDPRNAKIDGRARAGVEAAVQAGLARVVIAVTDFGRPAVARAASRDHVDHAPDRVRAPECGAWALDDLDALDHVGWNVLQRGQANRPRIDPDAVDEDQRVVALGAANEHRRGLAGTAVASHVEARMKTQQFRRVVGAATLDRVTVDDQRRRDYLAERRLDTRRRDDHRGRQRHRDRGAGRRCTCTPARKPPSPKKPRDDVKRTRT